MKTLFKTIIIVALTLPQLAFGKFTSYKELQLKDLEQMKALVQQYVDKANDALAPLDSSEVPAEVEDKAEQAAADEYRNALRIILSRPNRDNMVEKIIPDVQRGLKNLSSFEDTMISLSNEAIRFLKAGSSDADKLSTYLFILENLMAEIRPNIDSSKDFKQIFVNIRDAKIEIPEKVEKERRRRMYKKFSPSEVAKLVLKPYEKK